MRKLPFSAIVFIAGYAISTGVTAQNTYKCGNSYSQSPCPGGVVVDSADPRSSTQKMQTDAATTRDAKTAAAMEATRLKKEKTDLAANTSPINLASPAVDNNAASTPVSSELKAKKKEPAPFTAQVPGEKKKKSGAKKKAKKKTASAP